MAGRGPAPKDPAKRRRVNSDPAPSAVVTDDDELRGPDLPAGIEWPKPTRSWWETWRRSPQAQGLTATDWDFLVDTALLHARFWSGDEKVAAELRLRVAKFGATPEDRLRLRLQIGEPEAQQPPETQQRSRYAHLRVAESG